MLLLASLPRLRTREGLRQALRPFAIAAGGLVVVAIPMLLFIRSTRIEQSLIESHPGWQTLYIGDSPYHRVIVREKTGVRRTLQFSSAIQSMMPVKDPAGPGARTRMRFTSPDSSARRSGVS
jgi:hypothetical protein